MEQQRFSQERPKKNIKSLFWILINQLSMVTPVYLVLNQRCRAFWLPGGTVEGTVLGHT